MSSTAQAILRHAFTHIPTYGFSRQALSLASASVSPTGARLGDTAISALFGAGTDAEKTLLKAWMEEGRMKMSEAGEDEMVETGSGIGKGKGRAMEDVLLRRLEYNEPVLDHLKDAFALMATSSNPFIPVLNIQPAFDHAFAVADEACYLTSPPEGASTNFYTRRVGIAGIYAAAELHQMASPLTAPAFLSRLLAASLVPSQAIHELGMFAEFGIRGWGGILQGRGVST